VGAEAFAGAGRNAAQTPTIFTSSGGDGETIHEILSFLASNMRELSPTRFHNSVHNAPAGYWGIATGSRAASISLCSYDGSFVAGLVEAATQATVDQTPVALIAYDVQYPEPLNHVRPIGAPFAVAFILAPDPVERSFACLEMSLDEQAPEISVMALEELEVLRLNTPSARSLPLLNAIARKLDALVALPYLDNLALNVKVRPISPMLLHDRATKAIIQ
jgi:hypothetical protein